MIIIINREQTDYLEEKIRIKTESLRIRLNEYFIDYDRLRSGFITCNKFVWIKFFDIETNA